MEYKLTYFPLRGLAECIRFQLKYGGIEFEDDRVQKELWPQLKSKYNFGQLPILTVNGRQYSQSNAINRFVAKKVNLTGKDDFEDMEIDAIVDSIVDLRTKMHAYHFEKDETLKESKKDALLNETLPFYLGRLDQIAKENGDHFVGKRLTWADFYFVSFLESFNNFYGSDMLAEYPHLKAIENKVLTIPAIKAWVEVRPKTEF